MFLCLSLSLSPFLSLFLWCISNTTFLKVSTEKKQAQHIHRSNTTYWMSHNELPSLSGVFLNELIISLYLSLGFLYVSLSLSPFLSLFLWCISNTACLKVSTEKKQAQTIHRSNTTYWVSHNELPGERGGGMMMQRGQQRVRPNTVCP